MIAQIVIPSAEHVMPTGTQTNEANEEIKTHPIIFGAKMSQCSTKRIYLHVFECFSSVNHYVLLLLKDHFLFRLFLSD